MGAGIRAFFRSRDFVLAFSLAGLYFAHTWDQLQDRSFDYFRPAPYITWSVFGGELLQLTALALLFWLLIAGVERTRSRMLRTAGCVALLALLLLGLDGVRGVPDVRHITDSVFNAVGWTSVKVLAVAAGAFLIWATLAHERATIRGIRAVLLALCFLAPVNIVTTAAFVENHSYRARFDARPLLPLLPPSSAPRVVWIVFDEWDYYLSFPGRAKGLLLPELDRFAGQALSGDNVYPPAHDTQESLPSLITGRMVTTSQQAGPDRLLLTYLGSGEAVPWSSQPNVFDEARALSVNSAVVGFYHPYQRILNASFVQSFQTQEPQELHGLEKLEAIARGIPHMPRFAALSQAVKRVDQLQARILYTGVRDDAAKVVARPEFGLVLLHYPVPHPPSQNGDPGRDIRAGNRAAYDDNLRVVDRSLGNVRLALEKAGEWDAAAVLVTSDHPLRDYHGNNGHPWIPFLLKLPGQTAGITYNSPFNSVLTRQLIMALLRGEIKNSSEAAGWLDRNRLKYPVQTPPRVKPF